MEPLVIARGGQIVLELAGDPTSKELLEARNLVAHGGALELKVVDDCAAPAASGCTSADAHSGSPYMTQLHRDVARDPEAQRAGVRTEIDTWSNDNGSAHTDYYLRASDRVVLEQYLRDLATRDPSLRVPDDHELAFEHVTTSDDTHWRSYYLERAPRITGADISSVTGTADPNTGTPLVMLDFGSHGRQVFSDVTEQIVGMKLVAILDGTVVSAPVINAPIRGGRASIAMGGANIAAQEHTRDELVKSLRIRAILTPLRLVSESTLGTPAKP